MSFTTRIAYFFSILIILSSFPRFLQLIYNKEIYAFIMKKHRIVWKMKYTGFNVEIHISAVQALLSLKPVLIPGSKWLPKGICLAVELRSAFLGKAQPIIMNWNLNKWAAGLRLRRQSDRNIGYIPFKFCFLYIEIYRDFDWI